MLCFSTGATFFLLVLEVSFVVNMNGKLHDMSWGGMVLQVFKLPLNCTM
jgi:hypothetical protein